MTRTRRNMLMATRTEKLPSHEGMIARTLHGQLGTLNICVARAHVNAAQCAARV